MYTGTYTLVSGVRAGVCGPMATFISRRAVPPVPERRGTGRGRAVDTPAPARPPPGARFAGWPAIAP